jgi:hypothetical protein
MGQNVNALIATTSFVWFGISCSHSEILQFLSVSFLSFTSSTAPSSGGAMKLFDPKASTLLPLVLVDACLPYIDRRPNRKKKRKSARR